MGIPLYVSRTATFDGFGNASVEVGPTVYGTKWTITRMATNTNSGFSSTLRVYRNVVSQGTFVDGSSQGNSDVSDGSDIELLNLDKLVCVWTGGAPGATATITLTGTQEGR